MKALQDQNYELIKAAVLEGNESALPAHQRIMLSRWIDASKFLEKNPVQKNAVALLQVKYPNLSRTQAHEDCRNATQMFCSKVNFDFKLWHTWLINDCVELCQKAKACGDLKAWSLGQKNLIKALGDEPTSSHDPRMLEKSEVTIQIQVNNNTYNQKFNKFMDLDMETRKGIADALIVPAEDCDILEIMNS